MRIQAEANLAALIESTEDLIWSIDPRYRLITFNRAFREHIERNYGGPVAPGMGLAELLPPARAVLWHPLFDRALSGNKFRTELPLPDGRTLELAFNPIVVDGEMTGVSVFGKDISERKKAEESGRLLAAMVESSEDAIIAYSPSGLILTWNHGAEAIYGYTAEEMIGKPLSMLVAPERRAKAKQVIGQFLGGAPACHLQGTGLRKDGSKIHVTVTTWPIRGSAGEVTAICTIVRDVSLRYEAEKNRSLLVSVVESSEDLIHAVNLDGTIVSWNRGAERMAGYAREEILGKNAAILVTPSRKGKLPQNIESTQKGCAVGPFDTVIRRKDGTEIDVSITLSPIQNSAGEVTGVSVIARDITQRRQVETELRDSRERYRATFEQAAVGIIHASFEGRILLCNARFANLLGYAAEEMPGLTVQQITVPEDRAESAAAMQRILNGDAATESLEKRYLRKDGSLTWAKLTICIQRDGEGRALHFMAFAEDINARKAAEERLAASAAALRASEERYRTVFQTSVDCIAISRLSDGRYIDVNKAFLDLIGIELQEIVGRTSNELGIWAHPETRAKVVEILWRDSTIRDFQTQFVKKNGEIFWVLISGSVIEIEGVACIVSIVRDISGAKAAENTIQSLAFYDPLTGLPNRRMLLDRLRQTLSGGAPGNRLKALLLVDLDNLKTLNDTLGHQTGDLLLQEVARRMAACVREEETVGRIGGDEFTVLLEDLSEVPEEAATQAKAVGEIILASIGQPCLLEDRECLSAASMGITVYGDRQNSTDDILQQADIALHLAKAAGRNTMRFFSPDLQAAVNARATLEDDLRLAIKTKQFLLYYQPQVERGRMTGVEALIRWKHPSRGLVPPDDFIPLAEESRLILPVGDWVLETACAQLAAWAARSETEHLTVSVNISALQFRQPEFVEHVLAALDRTGANSKNLKLELTESLLVDNFEEVITKMTELKSHGLSFSLDDFGTGYSSLTYLKRLPLDQLKIDRTFVRDMLVDLTSGAIAQTIISLGRAMDLSVMAEGVETEEQRGFLTGLGCHSFQGYLFSRPLPLEELEVLLEDLN
jgi:diguanylate cyclase (GGDEF)-like protein/PAS domain S-box-containing protein